MTDPKSSQGSFDLGGLINKLKEMPSYKHKSMHVLDMVDPVLVVDLKQFKLDQLPAEFEELVAVYKGF